jgi:glucose-6-phosphate isomerase
MPFAQSLGARAGFEAALARTCAALDRLRRARDDGALPLLRLPARRDDLPELARLAAGWRARHRRFVLFGIGGSSLGARALAELAPPAERARLVVLDNLDPDAMARALAPEALEGTGFLLVSKSGGTAETLAQALAARAAVEAAFGRAALAERFLAIAEPGGNALRRLAEGMGAPALDHDPKVGGRFAVLSLVGMLPALLLGLDAAAVRAGAAEALAANLDAADPASAPAAQGAALNVSAGKAEAVLLAYVDALGLFGQWHRQLWAESLGKQGRGTTPVPALGPVDQHSQLQLWLEGPDDKLFTVIEAEAAGRGPRVPADAARALGLDYLAGRSIGDLVAAEGRATAETLAARGRPVRRLRFDRLDERVMGALMMHFMLETMIAADLLGVDAFDQPAVEEGKVLARRYLQEMG